VAGLFKGLFGGKGKDEPSPSSERKSAQKQGGAYFLNTDDAQTYGNVEYMRTAKKVRRTFPKTVNNEEIELEKEVSSINMNNPNLGTQIPKVSLGSSVPSTPETSPNLSENRSSSVPTDAQVAERRKSDSSMDMFRKMAKDIRK